MYSTVIAKQLITCKIINVPFFSILEIASEKETMVEIKTFVEVANVNKVGKGGGGGGGVCTYPITYKHGFCWISASPFRCAVSLSLLFSYTAVILWQEAIVVQVNILQWISKH